MKKSEQALEALWYINRKPLTAEYTDENFNTIYHPRLGNRLVTIDENCKGYVNKQDAIEAAKGFINHCRRILNLPDKFKTNGNEFNYIK